MISSGGFPGEPVLHDLCNRMTLRRVGASDRTSGGEAIEIQVQSEIPFPVRNELVVLRVGDRSLTISRYPDGDTHRLAFPLSPDEFGELRDGAEVWVQYGRDDSPERWPFGTLRKSSLR